MAAQVVEGTDCYVDRLSGADEGIAVLVLNRVASRNALSSGLLSGIRDAVSEILEDVYAGISLFGFY